jgi:hypothetical protein
MARSRKATARSLTWTSKPKNQRTVDGLGRLKFWSETTLKYRVNHFVDHNDTPFFALVKNLGNRRGRPQWEAISRHPDMAAAMSACEKHAAANA